MTIRLWRPITPLQPYPEQDFSQHDALRDQWLNRGTDVRDSGLTALHRIWAIETGIIEGICRLDEAQTRTLVEQGFEAGNIPQSGTGQEPRQPAGHPTGPLDCSGRHLLRSAPLPFDQPDGNPPTPPSNRRPPAHLPGLLSAGPAFRSTPSRRHVQDPAKQPHPTRTRRRDPPVLPARVRPVRARQLADLVRSVCRPARRLPSPVGRRVAPPPLRADPPICRRQRPGHARPRHLAPASAQLLAHHRYPLRPRRLHRRPRSGRRRRPRATGRIHSGPTKASHPGSDDSTELIHSETGRPDAGAAGFGPSARCLEFHPQSRLAGRPRRSTQLPHRRNTFRPVPLGRHSERSPSKR